MAKRKRKPSRARTFTPRFSDRQAYLLLGVISVVVRLPFLRNFDMVTHDGTAYVGQAKALLAGSVGGGSFPIGYPFFVALVALVVPDAVRAAQVVSFLASLGSLFVLYRLGKSLLGSKPALGAALALALIPVFIRHSLLSLSESIYLFWVLLGLLLFGRGAALGWGASFGMATITRPEALAVFVPLLLTRWRRMRQLFAATAIFLALYAVNAAYISASLGRIVVLPKSQLIGASVEGWRSQEAWIDREGKAGVEEALKEDKGTVAAIVNYGRRLPREIVFLGRHASPFVLLFAILGLVRKWRFIAAALVPFIAYPAVTFRSEARFVLPYIPILILFAIAGVGSISGSARRRAGYVLLGLSVAAGLILNRDELTRPVSGEFKYARDAGLEFRSRIEPGDRIADRKPFFAFYAGGEYAQIPVATYEETIDHLTNRGIRFLSLHRETIHALRPALRPLLYDRLAINGELRWRQVGLVASNWLIYERTGVLDPLRTQRLQPADRNLRMAPSWSPDGRFIVFRVMDPSGQGGIHVISEDGGRSQTVVSERVIKDPIAWSSDSNRIAFANDSKGNLDIYVYNMFTGTISQVTNHTASDQSPTWSRDGREIVFGSDRSGQREIWSKNLENGELRQLTTDGNNIFPSLSPSGRWLAWVNEREGVRIRDRSSNVIIRVPAPKRVNFAPAWSPREEFIAVEAEDWEGSKICLLTADGQQALLLTKTNEGEGMPTWSPDGLRIAIVSNRGEGLELTVLSGLNAYLSRLQNPIEITTLEPLETSDR